MKPKDAFQKVFVDDKSGMERNGCGGYVMIVLLPILAIVLKLL